MSPRALVRATLSLAMISVIASCGDSSTDPVLPDASDPYLMTTRAGDAVELLVQIKDSGGQPGVTGDYPPSFSLSSVPASVESAHVLAVSGIPVDPNGPFVPDMAVDYGDNTGVQKVTVTQSGGNLVRNQDGTWTQEPTSYSFSLSHTYSTATAKTYTITVLAATYGDYPSSRTLTKNISVSPNTDLYVNNFQVAPKAGFPADYSFDVSGPVGSGYDVSIDYGTGDTAHPSVASGGAVSGTYTWKNAGTYSMVITVSNGVRTKVVTKSVTVAVTYPKIEDYTAPDSVMAGEAVPFSFKLTGPGDGPYRVLIRFNDGSDDLILQLAPWTVYNGTHTYAVSGHYTIQAWASDANGLSHYPATGGVVEVHRPRPSITNLQFPQTAYVGEPIQVTFTAADPTDIPTLDYPNLFKLWAVMANPVGSGPPNMPQTYAVFAENSVDVNTTFTVDQPGDWTALVYVGSVQNGLEQVDSVRVNFTAVDLTCTAGTYRTDAGCVNAPVGTYVDQDGATQATPCPVGEYQDQTGQTSCKEAPAGTYVDIVGAAQATPCAQGTYQSQTGQTSCVPAEAGRYVDVEGATQSTPCSAGTYQPGTGAEACLKAPAGSFVSNIGSLSYEPCSAGTFSATTGSAACDDAPVGTFVANPGQTQATECAVGTYQDQTGQLSCKDAEPGYYVSIKGASQATACSAGTYQPASASSSCFDAPAGSFVSTMGSASYESCPAGTFSSSPGSASCTPAPAGSFVADAGQTQATLCTAGSYQNMEGQTSCIPAPAGRYVSADGATLATACSTGTYQPSTGSTSCLQADAGHFVATTGASAQAACALGTFQPDAGQTYCMAAPIGTYVDMVGSAVATTCPAGTSTLNVGSTSAADCISVGEIAVDHIESAIQAGTLTAASGGKSGENQFNAWVTNVQRAVRFLDGPQKQAGCVQVRNAIAKAGGNKPVVTGSSVAQVVADLQRVLTENGCTIR